ncbi:transposable element [Pseudoloma neurophilia]|uniref:Transposable element n=1 Tax=Pseudoloma neurophilia TaxID=146866 RepID=A0A0R0LYH1_9MICR|nr:transposable element [Pseudoloma neurophilia]
MATMGSKWLTVIDLKEAYYYIENEEKDKCKTAFEFKGRTYEWNGNGYKNSPMIMRRTMNQIFDDMIGKSVMIYLDDIIIFDRDINEHIVRSFLSDISLFYHLPFSLS